MTNRPIMIVEDDTDIGDVLTELLKGEGYPVWKTSNGQEALQKLRTESEKPGLIFLDLMMPVMGGRTFLNEIEGDESLAKLPIIVISAIAGGYENKVVEFMKKPMDLNQVLDAAAKYCRTDDVTPLPPPPSPAPFSHLRH